MKEQNIIPVFKERKVDIILQTKSYLYIYLDEQKRFEVYHILDFNNVYKNFEEINFVDTLF